MQLLLKMEKERRDVSIVGKEGASGKKKRGGGEEAQCLSKNASHNLSRAKSAARSEVRNVNVGSGSGQPVRMRHPPRGQSPPEKW